MGTAVAGGCCLFMWLLIAAPIGWLAQRRMNRVEAELGRRAVPELDREWLLYAGASVVWLSAVVIAGIGLAKREWARVGRNAVALAIAHFSFAVLAALTSMASDVLWGRDPTRMVLLILPFVAVCAAAVVGFAWRWTEARAKRIASGPPTGQQDPGALRWIVPLTALVFWPAGLVAPFVYRAPENVGVGTWAMRASMLFFALVVWGTCFGIFVLVAFY